MLPRPTTKEVMQKRLDACKVCPFRTQLPVVHTSVCSKCGCPIASKVRFEKSTCPDARW
jgi:hypothetical protein